MQGRARGVIVAALAALLTGGLATPALAAPTPTPPTSDVERLEAKIREKVEAGRWDADAARKFFGGGPSDPVPVVRGLNNPRQVTLLPSQGLLVSEAGRGGDVEIPGPFGPTYVGPTGSVSWVPAPAWQRESSPFRIVRDLLSSAGPDGSFAVGSNGVGARSLAHIDIPVTYENADFVAALPADLQEQAGKLLRSNVANRTRVFADLAAFEIANDPDGSNETGDTISNPYAALSQRNRTLVADAGANTVVSVDRKGEVSLFALLPDPPPFVVDGFDTDPVPTSLAEDRKGNIYVGTLASELPGAASVFIYGPDGGEPDRRNRRLHHDHRGRRGARRLDLRERAVRRRPGRHSAGSAHKDRAERRADDRPGSAAGGRRRGQVEQRLCRGLVGGIGRWPRSAGKPGGDPTDTGQRRTGLAVALLGEPRRMRKALGLMSQGLSVVRLSPEAQTVRTWSACGPFCPCVISNSTRWPSSSDR